MTTILRQPLDVPQLPTPLHVSREAGVLTHESPIRAPGVTRLEEARLPPGMAAEGGVSPGEGSPPPVDRLFLAGKFFQTPQFNDPLNTPYNSSFELSRVL